MTRDEAKAILKLFKQESIAANLLRGFVTAMAHQVDEDRADRCREVLKMVGPALHGPENFQCLTPLYNLAYGPSPSSASPAAPLKKRAMRARARSTSKK